jgi:MOSC domain-containing protein YiiM|tara:strand:- start:147 stop:590 length:444 start_codon:yes stop_codon:yes gene_type:complete
MIGKVFKIGIVKSGSQDINIVSSIRALRNEGLDGDRFCKINNDKRSQLTIIEKEVIDGYNKLTNNNVPYESFRRNIITENIKLNDLVNKELLIGNVKIKVHDLCEPCRHLQEVLMEKDLVKNLLHKGGIRCEIMTSGTISIGDNIKL